MLQGNTISFIFYFFNLFEEVPVKVWMRLNACNNNVYGELKRYSLYVRRYISIVKYCFKIVQTDNIILKTVYSQAVADCNKGYVNWVTNLKQLLNEYDFQYVFENPSSVCVKTFICELRTKIVFSFKQKWFNALKISHLLDMRFLKTFPFYSFYFIHELLNSVNSLYLRMLACLAFLKTLAAVKSRPVLHHCVVIFFWSSGIMECTCMLFTFENGVLLIR